MSSFIKYKNDVSFFSRVVIQKRIKTSKAVLFKDLKPTDHITIQASLGNMKDQHYAPVCIVYNVQTHEKRELSAKQILKCLESFEYTTII